MIRAAFWGNQSGKSHWGCAEIAWAVGKIHPYRPNYTGKIAARDCCVDFNAVQSILVPHYEDMLPREECVLPGLTFEGKPRLWPGLFGGSFEKAYNSNDKVLTLADGSFIEFKSYDQGWKKFQGARRHIIRMDEEPPDRRIYDENVARQISKKLGSEAPLNILISMTPIQPSMWMFTEIWEGSHTDDRIFASQMSSHENPYASIEVLEFMEKSIVDPAERAARLHGEFTWKEGRVYKGYGEHNLCDPFAVPPHWEVGLVIDPHPEKATAVNWFANSPDGHVFVIDEANIKGNIEYICDQIKTQSAGLRVTRMFIDKKAGEQRNSLDGRGALINEFRKHLPRLMPANNNVLTGISTVEQLASDGVTGPRLHVFRSCPRTHFQMGHYSWKGPTPSGERRNRPEVVKQNDEHPDCIRYWCNTARPDQFGDGIEDAEFNVGLY